MKKEKVLEALLVISTGLIALFYIFNIEWFILAALIVGLIGIFFYFLGKQIAWLWYKLSESLGFITSRIILAVIFYFFLFPIALISRIFRKEGILQLKKRNNESYYFTRNKTYVKQDFENIW